MRTLKNNIKYIYFMQGFFYLLSFIIVFGVMKYIISAEGCTYMDGGDALNQGYPVVGYIQALVKNKCFFSGFDYSIGLGEDNLLVLSCHGFLNPIHWIMAWIFQSKPTYLLYEYILVVKFFLGGYSFLIYANHKKKNPFLAIGASLIYAFSMWAMVYGLCFLGFYDVLIALPVMICGIERLYDEEKKVIWEIILSMVYLGLQGFYYLFWHCLIGGGYFLVKLIWDRKQKRIKYIFKFGINCLCALLLISPVFLPNIYWFLNSSRTNRVEYSIVELLPSLYELKTFLRSFLTPTVNTTSHYLLGNIALFSLIIFLLNYKKYKFECAVFIVSIIALITPGIGLLFNGMGYVTDRGFYFVWFVLAYSILCGMEEIICSEKKIMIYSMFILFFYSMFILFKEKEFFQYHFKNLIFFFVILSLVIIARYMKKKGVIIAILFISVIFTCSNNIFFLWNPDNEIQAEYANLQYAKKFVPVSQVIEDERKDYKQYICDDIWFRSEVESSLVLNEPLLKGFYSTGEYFSMVNSWGQRFRKEVEGEMAIRSLLGVRYYEQNGETIYNESAFPIVIGFDDYVTENQIETWSPVRRQDIVLQKIILQDEGKNRMQYDDNISTIPCNINYTNLSKKDEGNNFTATVDSHIEVKLDGNFDDGECYIVLKNALFGGHIKITDPIMKIGNNYVYTTMNEDVYSYVEPDKSGNIDITFLQNVDVEYDQIEVYFYSSDVIKKETAERKEILESSTELLHNKVTSDVIMKKDGYALYTIPYSKGWNAYVDGKHVPIRIADYGLMGIDLESGKHIIELVYVRPFQKAGWVAFGLGIIICLSLIGIGGIYRK